MKQVIQNYKTGELCVTEVPQPALRQQGVLVRNHYSVISLGTEGGVIRLGRQSLLGKAHDRPDLVRKMLNVAKRDGIFTAYKAAMRSLDTSLPLGYSCAGTVIEVGSEVTDITVGDRVACGGGGYANHAEVVYVPRNLCVLLPDEVDFRSAAFVTIGSVAVHSVRIADVRLGETVAIIGLGLIGLVTLQVLKSAGCRVIGIDLDPRKAALAKQLGADDALTREDPRLMGCVHQLTDGVGVDATIITAATTSNDPVELAGEITCRRGRVVTVGRVGTTIPRETYHYKELLFRSSLSYGPGRYDPRYEEKGIDYPISYVRWTENRNMEAFVELLRERVVQLEPIITHEFSITKAVEAYDIVLGETPSEAIVVGILLAYDPGRIIDHAPIPLLTSSSHSPLMEGIQIGVIGAGSFARNVLLPLLSQIPTARLRAISTATGVGARAVGEKYDFSYCTENPEAIIEDPEIDAVMILTRHDMHGPLVATALQAGKPVYVEKPLAVNQDHLDMITAAWENTNGQGRVMVGFNRRFAPLAVRLKQFFDGRTQPMVIAYRINAGFKPREHWTHDPLEGGGRIVGEVCHFVDFMQFMTSARPVLVWSRAIGGKAREDVINEDNFAVCIAFDDGSLGTLTYASNGSESYSKELVEIFCDGNVGVLEDFRRLRLVRGRRTKRLGLGFRQDKGHRAEMQQFVGALKEGDPFPTSFMDHVLTTEVTFGALASQKSNRPVDIG